MLDRLGITPQEVADSLRTCGIKGVRNTARFLNPIVRYAMGRVEGAVEIDLIAGDRVRIVFTNGDIQEVAVPDPVRQFLEAFHNGEHPDLELPGDSL
jgi:hypothetical protein